MRVLIVYTMTPFETTPTRLLARELEEQLLQRGYDAEILAIPFKADNFTDLLSQMMMVRAFELTHTDRIIALDFPAYLIRHTHKILWILDLSLRMQYYIHDNNESSSVVKMITAADVQTFHEAKKIFMGTQEAISVLPKSLCHQAILLSPPVCMNQDEVVISNPELRSSTWNITIERLLS